MIPIELAEFVVDGEARVRSDVDQLNGRLAEHRKAGGDLGADEYDELFTVVLEACAYSGRGALDYDGCLKALYPFIGRFSGSRSLDRWLPQLRAIAERSDVNKRTLRKEFLPNVSEIAPQTSPDTSFVEDESALPPESTAAEGNAKVSADFSGSPPSVGSSPEQTTWDELLVAWPPQRPLHHVDHRAVWDVWILRSALLFRRRLPVEYVDALTEDDEFWTTEVAADLAQSLTEPPRPEIIGKLNAALLNSRLRYLRPRLYLRAPQSPVIQAIGDRSDLAAAEESLVEEIGYPFVRSLRLIRDELNRGTNRSPRKGMLNDLQAYLEQVLDRMGVRPDHVGGASKVQFDPSQHRSSVPLEIGEEVTIVHAGLVDVKTGRRVFKAVVARPELEPGPGLDDGGSDNPVGELDAGDAPVDEGKQT